MFKNTDSNKKLWYTKIEYIQYFKITLNLYRNHLNNLQDLDQTWIKDPANLKNKKREKKKKISYKNTNNFSTLHFHF